MFWEGEENQTPGPNPDVLAGTSPADSRTNLEQLVQQLKIRFVNFYRSLSLHHAEREGFELLSCVVRNSLMTSRSYKDVWTLYIPAICPPSQSAISFLATYLTTNSLPENHCPNMLVTMAANNAVANGNHPLRRQLLDWLLPSIDDMKDGGHMISVQCVDHLLLAQVRTIDLIVTKCLREGHVLSHPAPTFQTLLDGGRLFNFVCRFAWEVFRF